MDAALRTMATATTVFTLVSHGRASMRDPRLPSLKSLMSAWMSVIDNVLLPVSAGSPGDIERPPDENIYLLYSLMKDIY
jgi:hypothetical protein